MKGNAVCHLFIPSLTEKLENWFHDFAFEIDAPHLTSLLLDFDSNKQAAYDLENAFFTLLDSNVKELPSALYRSHIHNIKCQEHLMCADPVHLEVGMNDVTLTKQVTDLTNDEAKELISKLNEHFNEDGLEFIFGSNQCWYISIKQNESIQSHHIDSMLMKNVIGKQAKSEQRNWQIIQNETQMLLHSSEINQQRELAGLETINSLWFWGSGKPITLKKEFQSIYIPKEASSQLRYQYYAKAADSDLQIIPEDVDQLLSALNTKNKSSIVLLDQLITPALVDDVEEFHRQVKFIDNQIIKPLVKAWRGGDINLEINCCNGKILTPKQPSFYKFWLKPTSLRALANDLGS